MAATSGTPSEIPGFQPHWSSRAAEPAGWHAQALHSILESVGDGVVVVDRKGKFLLFNRAAERIVGIGSREVAAGGWTEAYGLFLPDRVTPYPSDDLPLARAVRGETVSDSILFIRNAEIPRGALISVNCTPWRDSSGAPLGGIAVFRDITAQAEDRESVERLTNAVEQTADSVLITDPRGVILYVNSGFQQITGYSKDEALGQTPRLWKSDEHDAAFYQHMWGTLLSGGVYRGTLVNRRKSGELFHMEHTITPLKSASGAITNFVSVGRDLTERRKREEQDVELRIAGAVQQRLFPVRAPAGRGFDIAGGAYPASMMCGDYFDYIPLPGERLGIVIGDVSGHGLGPALVMAETRAALRAYLQTQLDVGGVLHALNETLVRDLEEGRYVTMLLATLDARGRSLSYANAGHPPGYVVSPSGEVKAQLESTSPPLGMFPDRGTHAAVTVGLEPGDVVVFLTDGVTESQAPDGSFLGAEGALGLLRAHRHGSAQQMLDGLISGIRAFVGGRPQIDDITAVICKAEFAP